MQLSKLTVNKTAIIKRINLDGKVLARLNSLGITVGAKIKVIRKAPLGDPIEIEVRGYTIAVRRQTLSKIEVIKV